MNTITTTPRLIVTLIVVLTLVGMLTTSSALAQEPPPPEEPFLEEIEVTVVNVDVYVTTKKGVPVTGLGREDFIVRENGRPVEVSFFQAVGGEPLADVEITAGETAAETAPPPPPIEPLHLVIYVDNLATRPENRARALEGVEEFLAEQLEPSTRVMVMSYDAGLTVRQRFTQDLDQVRTALRSMQKNSARGLEASSTRQTAFEAIARMLTDDCTPDVLTIANDYAQSMYSDVSRSLEALQKAVESLAGVPGRKALFYVSDGLPVRVGEELVLWVNQVCSLNFNQARTIDAAAVPNTDRLLREVASFANANRVTFYGLGSAGTPSYVPGEVAQAHQSNQEGGLFALAEATGGTAILRSNTLSRGLARVANDFTHYYSIGYQALSQASETGRKITVEVARKGVDVRYRRAYRDKSTGELLTERILAALLYGAESNPLELIVEPGAQETGEDGAVQMPVIVDIPLGNVAFLPDENGYVARLKLLVGIRDGEGRTSPIREAPIVVEVPEDRLDEARQALYRYQVRMTLRPGEQTIAVGIHDEASKIASFLARTLVIGRALGD